MNNIQQQQFDDFLKKNPEIQDQIKQIDQDCENKINNTRKQANKMLQEAKYKHNNMIDQVNNKLQDQFEQDKNQYQNIVDNNINFSQQIIFHDVMSVVYKKKHLLIDSMYYVLLAIIQIVWLTIWGFFLGFDSLNDNFQNQQVMITVYINISTNIQNIGFNIFVFFGSFVKISYLLEEKQTSFFQFIFTLNYFMMVLGFNCYTIDQTKVYKVLYHDFSIKSINQYGGQISLLLVFWLFFSLFSIFSCGIVHCIHSFQEIQNSMKSKYKEFINET